MNSNTAQSLLTDTITQYGVSAFVIISAVVGIALGYLVFKKGWTWTRLSLSNKSYDEVAKMRGNRSISSEDYSFYMKSKGYSDL